MSRKDDLTGKGAMRGYKRSHALNTSNRKWDLNLQTANLKVGKDQSVRVKVSARTLKTLRKNNKLA